MEEIPQGHSQVDFIIKTNHLSQSPLYFIIEVCEKLFSG